MQKASEPTLREQLLADYDAHEDAIDKASIAETWALGDWLAEYVPPRHPGPRGVSEAECVISLEDLADRRGRSLRYLQELRKVALVTEPDRLPLISVRAYGEALRHNSWDLMAANKALVTKGHRLRDQTPHAMESVESIKANLVKRSPEQRAELVRELVSDPDVAAEPTVRELLRGEPLPDFGAAWVDKLIIRVHDRTLALASHVKREGLVFAPGADVELHLRWLEEAERQVADVRAAVQERVRDARMEGVS